MVRLSLSTFKASAILISAFVSFAIQSPSPMALAFEIQPHLIPTLAPSLLHTDNNTHKYGTFNNISRGGGSFLRSSTSDEDNTSEPVELTTRQEGISKMKSCYKTAFLFCGVDVLARLTETRGGWEKLVISRPSSLVDFADVASSLNILFFGIGLWWVTKLYEKISTSSSTAGSTADMSLATQIMGTYKTMYSLTAWSMIALSCRLVSKVFVSGTISPLSVLAVAVCISFYINTKDKELSNDINSTVSKGIEAAKSMEFCSVSFLLFSITRFLFWATIGIFGDLPLVIKIIHINKFVMPLILYKLLQELNVNFLNATKELSTSSSDNHELDFSVFEKLKEAEAGFYGKVTKVLRAVTILNIVRYAIRLSRGYS